MKKHWRILLLVVLALLLIGLAFLKGWIVTDHSAQRRGEGVFWNGIMYVGASGEYTEDRTIAKTEDGWNIVSVKEDKSHTFVVLRSFLDNYLLVREDYEIPTSGTVTAGSWNGKKIEDAAFCAAVAAIVEGKQSDFSYETSAISHLREDQHMRRLYLAYENCPIGTEFVGWMGTVNGVWCITTQVSSTSDTVWCYEIPQEYISVLEPFIS